MRGGRRRLHEAKYEAAVAGLVLAACASGSSLRDLDLRGNRFSPKVVLQTMLPSTQTRSPTPMKFVLHCMIYVRSSVIIVDHQLRHTPNRCMLSVCNAHDASPSGGLPPLYLGYKAISQTYQSPCLDRRRLYRYVEATDAAFACLGVRHSH